ncbi:hypothetical protein ACFSJY_02200 [Thalassotalea euphylliae]|uniref:hypothetical protein n=1 Tax=Thalassotalea euphylliae TaxID=1655234 RepID=UPI0036309835
MTQAITRYMRMDGWIFEVKSVRALKVDSYGQPYEAIAHLNINGDFAFLDGTMHAHDAQFTEQDLATFQSVCQALGVTSLKYDRRHHLAGADECSSDTHGNDTIRKIA